MAKKSEKYFLTPIKRSHLVLLNGVGSLVRARSKVTALVCDIHEWTRTIPTGNAQGVEKDAAREKVLKEFKIRDQILEDAVGIDYLVSPPPYPDDQISKSSKWGLPLTRFPVGQICTNTRCNRFSTADSSDMRVHYGRNLGCRECNSEKPRMKRQVTVMLVCQFGHIDEINFSELAHGFALGGSICASPDIRVTFSQGPKRPVAKCAYCQLEGGGEKFEIKCTGRRPWVVGLPTQNEVCDQTMRVVERTSVQIYYASTKSSIFIPQIGVDERLVRWLATKVDIAMLDRLTKDSPIHRTWLERATQAGFSDLTPDDLVKHLDLAFPVRPEVREASWDPIRAKAHEFAQLSNKSEAYYRQELLEYREVTDFGNSKYIGSDKIIERVVAVEKLAETRMLDGFSRWKPKNPSPDVGFAQIWGRNSTSNEERWLPGYRVTGEGILFVFSVAQIANWAASNNGLFSDVSLFREPSQQPEKYSLAGRLVHTFSHAVMKALSDRCGYPLPGIRDRVYDLHEGAVGVLVYTADGDSLGTLGGLVEHADGHRLADLISDAINTSRWCAQDPVCNSAKSDDELRTSGACHHCVLVPETSCEIFNKEVDRALIVGSSERGIKGAFE